MGLRKEITYKGETRSVKEWAVWAGINPVTFGGRLREGMRFEEAIIRPKTTSHPPRTPAENKLLGPMLSKRWA